MKLKKKKRKKETLARRSACRCARMSFDNAHKVSSLYDGRDTHVQTRTGAGIPSARFDPVSNLVKEPRYNIITKLMTLNTTKLLTQNDYSNLVKMSINQLVLIIHTRTLQIIYQF